MTSDFVEFVATLESPEFDVVNALKATTAEESDPEPIGVLYPRRQPANGVVVRDGRTIARWGDIRVPDMAFSVSKALLSLCAGLAWTKGLITDMHEPVGGWVSRLELGPDQLTGIEDLGDTSWHHLLQQTGSWEGAVWGKHTSIDRQMDRYGHAANASGFAPGTRWNMNNVRVNLLALALSSVFEDSLESVLRRDIMNPLGGSGSWRWNGYANSYCRLGGRMRQVVSGGAHWGGGIYISSADLALIGKLCAGRGRFGAQQLLSPEWFDMAWDPCPVAPEGSGYLWHLNTGHELSALAPASGVAALGGTHALGVNMLWVDPDTDVVAVSRWMAFDRIGNFLDRMSANV
ncbi:serine hydrolase [Brevibacterium sp.]|uniref:serine hydrolase domain-containing protein n=1 Tax=Brevibacterium sp. TaxID=1701 RepID=UPI0028119E3B|nr:serine hydrolase [Brevibacterium sp.]